MVLSAGLRPSSIRVGKGESSTLVGASCCRQFFFELNDAGALLLAFVASRVGGGSGWTGRQNGSCFVDQSLL